MAQNADEAQVMRLLEAEGKQMPRDALSKKLGWPKDRLSQALNNLRQRGEVTSTWRRHPVYSINADYRAPAASKEQRDAFLKALKALEGRTTNKRLMQRLKLDADTYYQIRNALLDDGLIRKTRGRGGVVELEEPSDAGVAEAAIAETEALPAAEADLYEPIKTVLQGESFADGFLQRSLLWDAPAPPGTASRRLGPAPGPLGRRPAPAQSRGRPRPNKVGAPGARASRVGVHPKASGVLPSPPGPWGRPRASPPSRWRRPRPGASGARKVVSRAETLGHAQRCS